MSTETHWFWLVNGKADGQSLHVPADIQAQYVVLGNKLLRMTREAMSAAGLTTNRQNMLLTDGTRITAQVGPKFSRLIVDVLPTPQRKPEEAALKPDVETGAPYLWVGVRHEAWADATTSFTRYTTPQDIKHEGQGVSMMLIEPDGSTTMTGALAINWNRTHCIGHTHASETGGQSYPADQASIHQPDPWVDFIRSQYLGIDDAGIFQNETWPTVFDTGYSSEGAALFGVLQPVGKEPLTAYFGEIGGIYFSPNGVMGYCRVLDWAMRYAHTLVVDPNTGDATSMAENQPWSTSLSPFDPEAPLNDGIYPDGQMRSAAAGIEYDRMTWRANSAYVGWGGFENRVFTASYWDAVLCLDPQGLALKNPGTREIDKVAHQFVKDKTNALYGKTPKAQTGKYIIKVQRVGSSYPEVQRRYQPAANDFPLDIEIEVRVGWPVAQRLTKKIRLEASLDLLHPSLPHGEVSRAGSSGGPSGALIGAFSAPAGTPLIVPPKHSPVWWRGAILVDVVNQTIEVLDHYCPESLGADDSWADAIQSDLDFLQSTGY